MKRQHASRVRSSAQFLAAPLMIAGMMLNAVRAVGEDIAAPNPVMQSASAQTAGAAQPDANGAPSQAVHKSHINNGGKAMISAGFVLIGAGVLTIATTAALSSSGFRPSGAKGPALYAGGAGAAAVGVTLISFGFHKRSRK